MKRAAIIICSFWVIANAYGQGCSDPGICTIGTLNSGTTNDTVSSVNFVDADIDALLNSKIVDEKYKIGLEGVYGAGERGASLYSIVLRSSIRINEKLLANIKLPYTLISGTLGNTSSIGDITISLQNTFKSGNNMRMAYTFGAVIPTNNSNLMINGQPLPMVYQTSLGAINILGGLSYAYKGWGASFGYQHSFGSNGNEFTTENIETDETSPNYEPLNEERIRYGSSRHLERGSDVILRLEKKIRIGKFNLLAGALPIYRLNASYIEMMDGTAQEVKGSDGLTLNLTAGLSYNIKNNWRIISNVGIPVIQRAAVPDGLARSYVIIVGATYRAW